MRLFEILDKYCVEQVERKVVDKGRQKIAIDHIKRFFGDCLLGDITMLAVLDYIEQRGVSNATVRRELNVLLSAVNHCVKWRYIASDEAPVIELPTVDAEPVGFFTKKEVQMLIDEAQGELKHFIVLAYYTGARRMAVSDLTLAQIDRDIKRIHLKPAGKKQTKKRMPIVPIYPEIEASLDALIGDRTEGRLFRQRHFYGPFRALCEKIGLGDRHHPHLLRHSRATHLLQSGTSIFFVAKLLGDTVQTVERVYGHHCPDYLLEAA